MKEIIVKYQRISIRFRNSAVLLLTAAGLLSGLSVQAQNFLRNPSFEEIEANNPFVPKHWQIVKSGGIERNHKIDKIRSRDGRLSAKLENNLDEFSGIMLAWMQNVDGKITELPAGTVLEFSVWVTSENKPAAVRMYAEGFHSGKTYMTPTTIINPGEWREIKGSFTVDANMKAGYVCLQLLGCGRVSFDCVYLGPERNGNAAPPPPGISSQEVIDNGGIENIAKDSGLPAGWKKIAGDAAGNLSVSGTAKDGIRALQLESAEKAPSGILGWQYTFRPEEAARLKPNAEMTLSLEANTHGNPGTKFEYELELRKGGKTLGRYTAGKQSIYLGWERKELNFQVPRETPTDAVLRIRLLTAGKLNIDNVSLLPAMAAAKKTGQWELVENYCRVTNFPAQNTYTLPARPRMFSISCCLPAPELELTLTEIDGRELKRWTWEKLPVRKEAKVRIGLPELPEGAYELKYRSGAMTDYDWFRIRTKQARGAYFDEDGILHVNRNPVFPNIITTPLNDLDAYRVYSKSGINTLHVQLSGDPLVVNYMLTGLEKFNLMALPWENWGEADAELTDVELRIKMHQLKNLFQERDNIIGLMTDEMATQRVNLLDSIRKHYKFRYKYLQDYVFWHNLAPRLTGDPNDPRQKFEAVRRFARACDVTGVDIYPIPQSIGHNNLPNQTLSCVGDYTDLSHKLVWNQKPVWMILQGMRWGNNRLPNGAELRFMIWNAVTHGATGIGWYGHACEEIYSDWWREFADANLELSKIGAMLVLGGVKRIPGLPSRIRAIEGKGFLVYVNEDAWKTVEFPVKKGQWFESPTGKAFSGEQAVLKPNSVLILTENPLVIPKTGRFTPQEIQMSGFKKIRKTTMLLDANWVAHPEIQKRDTTVYGRQSFTVDTAPQDAVLIFAADDHAKFFLNGKEIGKGGGHKILRQFPIGQMLRKGENLLTFELYNAFAATGVVYELRLGDRKITSGKETMFSPDGRTAWKKAYLFGKPPVEPWKGQTVIIENGTFF